MTNKVQVTNVDIGFKALAQLICSRANFSLKLFESVFLKILFRWSNACLEKFMYSQKYKLQDIKKSVQFLRI